MGHSPATAVPAPCRPLWPIERRAFCPVAVPQRRLEHEAQSESERVAARIDAVASDVRHMHTAKASHRELLSVVAKLRHRPRPGHGSPMPIAVQPLLAVPCMMPHPPDKAPVAGKVPPHSLSRPPSAKSARRDEWRREGHEKPPARSRPVA